MNKLETYNLIASCLTLDLLPEKRNEILQILTSNSINWNRFFQIGSNHLVLQNIYQVFNTHQIIPEIPEEVSKELSNIFTLNAKRNELILEHACEMNTLLTSKGITPVFLKGVAHLMNGLYHDPAERIMGDIDLLVDKKEILPAVEILTQNAYEAPVKLSDELKHIYKKHHPRLHKPGMPAYIEIHWDAVKSPYNKSFSQEEIFSKKIPSIHYPECHTMSIEDAAIHNFIHSQLEHGGHNYARVYLRNMYDQLLLSAKCDLQNTFDTYGQFTRKSGSYLQLIEKVFGITLLDEEHRKSSSKFFLYRHQQNVRYITASFIFQLLNQFYISYIRKFFLFITSKKIRMLTYKNLSSRDWYKQHFKSYRKLFSRTK